MHELSVCLSLLGELERIAAERAAGRITRIELAIGPLSGVEPALLRHAWPLAAAGTRAEDAELVIDEAEVVVECTRCGAESKVPPNRLLCASCGDFRTRIVSGDDMLLRRVELANVGRHRDNPARDERLTDNHC